MEKLTKEIALEAFRSSMFNPTDIQIVHNITNLNAHVQSVEDYGYLTIAFGCQSGLTWHGSWKDAEEYFSYYYRDDVELKICPECEKKVTVNDYIEVEEQFGDLLKRISSGFIKNPTKNEELLWSGKLHVECYNKRSGLRHLLRHVMGLK